MIFLLLFGVINVVGRKIYVIINEKCVILVVLGRKSVVGNVFFNVVDR